MKKRILLMHLTLIISCTMSDEQSHYHRLLEYEGTYEYINQSTLTLEASELDTILYAVIDGAKYPLEYISKDTFLNNQESPVIFHRADNEIIGYRADGKTFKHLDTPFNKMEFLPRRKLYGHSENYEYQVPEFLGDGLAVGDIEEEIKNPSLIFNMIRETIDGTYRDVNSILIVKNDKLVLEEYFYGYDADTPHPLRSATKPFIGGILGIAIDQGLIKSEKENILPFFTSMYSDIAHIDERKKQLTIEHLLMYRHGLDCENNNPESRGNEYSMMQSEDWVKHTLDLPMVKEAGESSSYCTGCALAIGSLVEITTSENIETFAEEHLFKPMGIRNYDWTFEPNKSSSTTFNTMKLRPRDLAKLAKMYKDGGMWNGRQVISKNWVDKTFHMDTGDYGFLWLHKFFTIDGRRYNSYMASGNGGQKINIWPELDMITVFTGANYNSYQLYGKTTPPNEMIPKFILPSLE